MLFVVLINILIWLLSAVIIFTNLPDFHVRECSLKNFLHRAIIDFCLAWLASLYTLKTSPSPRPQLKYLFIFICKVYLITNSRGNSRVTDHWWVIERLRFTLTGRGEGWRGYIARDRRAVVWSATSGVTEPLLGGYQPLYYCGHLHQSHLLRSITGGSGY